MMTSNKASFITEDPWSNLRTFTDARIGLGRAGGSIPLHEVLNFRLAHAQARDAVHTPIDFSKIQRELARENISSHVLQSRAEDRNTYLTRPDLGRRLSAASWDVLEGQKKNWDIAVVLCDGLSSKAIHENGSLFLCAFTEKLQYTQYTMAPVQMVTNGRVAVGDEIGECLRARMVVVLIGERPGLSSPNSMGIYLTMAPTVGTTDESRNCISNVRHGGLSIEGGVQKLSYLMDKAFEEKRTGVLLKDDMPKNYLPFNQAEHLN